MQNSKNQKYRLGLDLGTNSIGWAMLALDHENQPYKILDAGARIFSDGRNPKDGTPLAVARRTARGMRRRRDRFLARKSKSMNCLVRFGLMPKDEIERKKLESLNPYELRAKALDEALSPHQLGRAIFHLNQRRGFKSNRKEQISEDKKLSETKQNQEDLAKKIVETNSRTLGEFFYKERILKTLTARAKPDESGLYPTRKMYEDEFDLIQKTQLQFQKISPENWAEIREIIFHQRPLKPQEKGVCQFINKHNSLPDWAAEIFENYLNSSKENKKAKGLPRAYLALPSYQKFRILSEINNLKIIKNNREEILLDAAQKRKIIEYLHEKKSASFSSLRKQIGYGSEEFQFNFEGGKRDKLQGNETEILLKDKKYFGEKWQNFSLKEQDEIVEFLLDSEDENSIYQKALNDWKSSEEQALEVKKITPNNFKSGVGNLSKELLQRLVAEIEEKNCRYDEATKNLGFHHSKKEAGEIQSQLDYYGKVLQASTVPVKYGSEEEIDFGKIANPTVHVALNQLRKVVNEIIKENGKPSEIVVELARDLKISKDEKREIESQQSKNQKENDDLKKELESLGQRNSYDNRLKLKLFRELEKANNGVACCPYSGRPINITNLFSHEVEIEHILPFAKTYDDSIANKTIAYRLKNQKKGNRSPFEAFGDITFERIQNLPKNKRWRFYENAMEKFKDESGFQERQLNDTRYLSKIASQYLSQICDPNKIKVANGKLTSLLRHHWGLNGILKKNESRSNHSPLEGESKSRSDFGEGLDFVNQHQLQFSNPSPNASHSTLPQGEGDYLELEEKGESKPKNRDDHRHHAVDAIVIAMTETKLLQQISRDNARGHDLDRLIINLPSHWNRFREDAVEAIERIIVSHKSDHGKDGELHEATYYGILSQPESIEQENGKLDEGYNVVYSKPLASLTDGQISSIRNQKIREELKKKLAGITDKKEVAKILAEELTIEGKKGKQTKLKIKNIRLLKKEESVMPITHKQLTPQKKELGGVEQKTHIKGVVPGSNHHIAFWKLPKLPFLPLLKLKGTKFEKLLQSLNAKELENFEKFKARQEQLKSWIAKDGSYAAVCSSFFEINSGNDSNDFRPHPDAKLLMKIHNGDLVKLKEEEKYVVAKVTTLKPSANKIILVEHNEAGNLKNRIEKEKTLKPINCTFSSIAEKQLRKIFVSPIGKVFDSGAILKNTENQAE